MTYDILRSNMVSGIGRGMALSNKNVESAGKTGTTNDNKDGWFVGLTKDITTAVWVGYDNPKSVSSLYGSSYPGRIWKGFMDYAHKDYTEKLEVEMPETLVRAYVDSNGKKVPAHYPGAKLEIFPSSKQPEENKNAEKEIIIFGFKDKIDKLLSKDTTLSLDEIKSQLENLKVKIKEAYDNEEITGEEYVSLTGKIDYDLREYIKNLNNSSEDESSSDNSDNSNE